MRVVVLGGSGTLGRAVVAELGARGAEAVAASRRTGVDLGTGAGLAEVLDGVDAVVHAATSPLRPRRVDLGGTRRLLEVLRSTGSTAHVVYVSIVGCDTNPYPYYRVKAACERELGTAGVPATVLRATQFHPLVAGIARAARPLGVGLTVRGTAAQPCDVAWVAGRVADVALGAPPAGTVRSPDLAGPEELSLADTVRLLAAHDGVRLRRLVTLPALGGVARAFAAGRNLPAPDAQVGGAGFGGWLDAQPVSGR